ncbi:MAG: hypothetical protein ACYC01_10820 [Lutibacter sp.]
MKSLKMSIYLLLIISLFTGCEKETTTLPENPAMNVQDTKIIDQNSYKSLFDMIMAGVDMESYYKSLPEQDLKMSNQTTSQITEYTGVEFFYESEAGFDFPCNNMPTEDFSSIDIEMSDGSLYFVGSPLDMNTDNGYFSPGDILPGISFTSTNGLYVWNSSYWDANKLIFTSNYFDDLIINFTSANVTSVSMKIAQVWTGGYTNIDIAVYDFSDNLLGTSGVYIQPYGINWGVTSVEPIKKIILTGYFPGVDNVSFGICDDLDGDGVLNENDAHPNSDMSEFINIVGCNPNVKNVLVKNGSTMMDQITDLIADINSQYNGDNYTYLHKRFMTKLAQITYNWRIAKLITTTERSRISSCAWGANIPYLIYD